VTGEVRWEIKWMGRRKTLICQIMFSVHPPQIIFNVEHYFCIHILMGDLSNYTMYYHVA
jgi:hypothetical protein